MNELCNNITYKYTHIFDCVVFIILAKVEFELLPLKFQFFRAHLQRSHKIGNVHTDATRYFARDKDVSRGAAPHFNVFTRKYRLFHCTFI